METAAQYLVVALAVTGGVSALLFVVLAPVWLGSKEVAALRGLWRLPQLEGG